MKSQHMAIAVALAVGTGIGIGIGATGRDAARPAFAQVATQPASRPTALPVAQEGPEANMIAVARAITPTVVSVSRPGGSGSGVIIRRDGVVLTNAHVVGNARTVQIGLADGRRVQGQVAG